MSHSTADRRQVSGEIADWLHRYEPRSVSSLLWRHQLRDFIAPAVMRLAPVRLSSPGSTVRVLTQVSAWCLSQGMPLGWEVILDPDTVERFVSEGIKHDRCRGTNRATLRRLDPLLTTKAPWEPRAEAVNRRRLAAPYSADELELLWRDAQHQATPARLRAGRALIALGVRTGLDGRWSTRVAAEDVIRRDGVVLVRAGEPAAWLVPLLARWEDVVLELAAWARGEFLVGGRSLTRNRAGDLARKFKVGHGHPALSAPRLRSPGCFTS